MTDPVSYGPSKPTPDPTILTTEQLLREVGGAQRFNRAQDDAMRDLLDEKFQSVQTQLSLVERQRVEQKNDTKAAVDAALAAAKEAVKEQTTAFGLATAKSETATAEQLKQLTVTFTTAISGVTNQLGDLKTRVERIENLKQGGRDQVAAIYAFVGFLVAIITLGAVIAATGGFS